MPPAGHSDSGIRGPVMRPHLRSGSWWGLLVKGSGVSVPTAGMLSMSARRPKVPSELRQRVLIEAGHRCAIPACKSTPAEIAHITPWPKVRKHEFKNLTALCPTCHTRFDDPHGPIDRKAMRQYKVNLNPLLSGTSATGKVRRPGWPPTRSLGQGLPSGSPLKPDMRQQSHADPHQSNVSRTLDRRLSINFHGFFVPH
ncbi:HNH endonuclease [Streptomyces melanogenes]|uniref:HNH endonuclease n=1 Tax=Streptomyces melanogenes TaxID=67326 RepID=UPI003793AEA6